MPRSLKKYLFKIGIIGLWILVFVCGAIVFKNHPSDDVVVLNKSEWKCILWDERVVVSDTNGNRAIIMNAADPFRECVGWVRVEVWQPTK